MLLILSILLAVSPFQIDEIEVVAERAQVQSEAFQMVAQVSHDEIAALPITNIADILAYLPGLDVRSRGTSDSQTDISLRGGTFDQVLVLLNGVRLTDAQTGHYSLHIPVSPALIDRIEILQGSAIHLTGALCGAINIITRNTSDNQYTVQLSGGTNGDVSPMFAASAVRDEVHINTSAHYARSKDYYAPNANEKEQEALNHTDYQVADLYLQTRWRGLDVQLGAQYKDAGLGTGYGYASTDQFDATRTLIASTSYQHSFDTPWTLAAQAGYRANYDRYEWHRGTATPNRHWTHAAQASLQAHYVSRIGRTSVGVEMDHQTILSSSMGHHNRLQASISAEQQFIWQSLAASIGVAGHYNTWFGWYASGAANIGYSFLKTGIVYVGATRSLRMPTWTDLFYNAGVQRGSSDLKAEKAWMISVGGKYTWSWDKAGSLFVSSDAWYRFGQDIIDWTYSPSDGLYYATNQHRVNTFGIDLIASYRYNQWLRSITIRYAYTNLSIDLAKTRSNYLDFLRHKLTCSIEHGIYCWSKGSIGATWSLRWQQREGTYVDIYGTPDHAYKPTLLLDGCIYAEYAHMRVSLESNNMTNRHFYDYGGVLQPGAHGCIKLSYTF